MNGVARGIGAGLAEVLGTGLDIILSHGFEPLDPGCAQGLESGLEEVFPGWGRGGLGQFELLTQPSAWVREGLGVVMDLQDEIRDHVLPAIAEIQDERLDMV